MRIGLGLTMVTAALLCVSGCDDKSDSGSDTGSDPLVEDSDGHDTDEPDTDGHDTEGHDTDEPDTDGEETEGPDTDGEAQHCDEPGTTQACADEGLQYCYSAGGEDIWGPCVTSAECVPGDSRPCFGDGEGGSGGFEDLDQRCIVRGGVPEWDLDACNTPLVLAFEPGAVQMTAAATASFDITGAGECITTDWPAAATPWLAIDLDKSGAIDGGHELFGSGTVLPSGQHASNGFVALSQLDSNGDGVISALDERFDELVLWSDYDGDRTSTLWELEPLAQRGVDSIDLAFSDGDDCDARGNCARERSAFSFASSGRVSAGQVLDLYLACQ